MMCSPLGILSWEGPAVALGSLCLSPARVPVLEWPLEGGVDATRIPVKKCDGSACPAQNPKWVFVEDP